MAEIKLTKNELRAQQLRLGQLQKYLPTLQLKKAMLQSEVQEARQEIATYKKERDALRSKVDVWAELLATKTSIVPADVVKVVSVGKRYENIAGVEVPYFERVTYADLAYSLFDTPPWVDAAVKELQGLSSAVIKISVAEEKKAALDKELREVSIRVNLFEKILIPRALANIKKIKVFLGDQQLAAVSQAKVAKGKIQANKTLWKEAG